MTPAILPEIDVAALGPAMQALTPLQRNFVLAKVYLGLHDEGAARAAGYAASTVADHAYTIAHHEGVQAAILEVGKKLLRSEGARSILTMVRIRDDERVKADTRLRAAEMIANRSGFHTTTEHHLEVTHHLSEAEQDKRILALCAELGMAPDEAKKMLIAPAEMTRNAEGVFELAPPTELSTDPIQVAKRNTRHRRAGMSPDEIEADKARIEAERVDRLKREYAAATDVEADDPEPDPDGLDAYLNERNRHD